MSTARVLLDSNILILASLGQVDMRSIVARYDEVLISIITEVEVLGFKFPTADEQKITEQAVAATLVLPFTEVEAQHAIRYRKLRKIKFPDAAILTTARAAGADLLTQNIGDFRGLDPAVRVLMVQEL